MIDWKEAIEWIDEGKISGSIWEITAKSKWILLQKYTNWLIKKRMNWSWQIDDEWMLNGNNDLFCGEKSVKLFIIQTTLIQINKLRNLNLAKRKKTTTLQLYTKHNRWPINISFHWSIYFVRFDHPIYLFQNLSSSSRR